MAYQWDMGADTGGGYTTAITVDSLNPGRAVTGGDQWGAPLYTDNYGDKWFGAMLGAPSLTGNPPYLRAAQFSKRPGNSGRCYLGWGPMQSSGGGFAYIEKGSNTFHAVNGTDAFGTALTGGNGFYPRPVGELIQTTYDAVKDTDYIFLMPPSGSLVRYTCSSTGAPGNRTILSTLASGPYYKATCLIDNSTMMVAEYNKTITGAANTGAVHLFTAGDLRTASTASHTVLSGAPANVTDISLINGNVFATTLTGLYAVTGSNYNTWTLLKGQVTGGFDDTLGSLDGSQTGNIITIHVGQGDSAQSLPAGHSFARLTCDVTSSGGITNPANWTLAWESLSGNIQNAQWGTLWGVANAPWWLYNVAGTPGANIYDCSMLRVDPTNPQNIYAVGRGGGCWSSRNGGDLWRPAHVGLNGSQENGIQLSGSTLTTNNTDWNSAVSTDKFHTCHQGSTNTIGGNASTTVNVTGQGSTTYAYSTSGSGDVTMAIGTGAAVSIADTAFGGYFRKPQGIVADSSGTVYIAMWGGVLVGSSSSSPQPLVPPVLAQPVVSGTSVTSSWSSASGGTSPYSYQVSYDSGAFATPSSGASGLTDTRTLSAGSHTLVVRVLDNTGATALSSQVGFTVSPLVAPVITAPLNGSVVSTASLVTTWAAPTSGVPPYTYAIAYDGGAFTAANGTLADTHTFTNGAHTLQVRVTDSTNATATTSSISFTISGLTAGTITTPTPGQTFSTTAITANWNAATGGTAPYTYKIQYDSTAFRSPSSSALTPVVPVDTTRYLGITANPRNSRTDAQELTYVNNQISPETYQIIRRYHGWDRDLIDGYESGIAPPQIISPYWFITNANNTFTTYLAILNGSQDAIIDRNAAACKAYGRPMFLTWQMEPENDTGTAGSAANFILAYQRVVNRFRAAGVTNVSWVWVLMDSTHQAGTQEQWYPGDGYVDWIGVDGYNWVDQGGHSAPWKSFQTIFQPFLNYLVLKGKPGFIGETATVLDPAISNRKGLWYDDMVTTLATTAWSPVKALSYFNSQPFNTSPLWWLDDDASGTSPNTIDVTHWKAAAANAMWNVATSGLTDTATLALGTHTVRIQVTDNVGTVVTSPATTFNIGSLAAPVITSPVNGTTLTTANVNTTWTASSGGTSPYTYAISYDGGGFVATTGLSNAVNLGNGPHTVQVRATDATLTVALSAIISFTVAATISAPVVTAPPVPITTASFVTTWTAATSSGGGITYQISYNNGANFATPSSGATGLSDTHTFTDGTYTVLVKATDINNLTATSSPVTYSVQSTPPPAPTIDAGPAVFSGGTTSSTTATFTFHEAGNVNPVVFTGQITGRAAAIITSPVTYSPLTAGAYVFTLTARDTVTNLVSSAATWTWTITPTVLPATPVITSGPPLGGASASQTVTIRNTGTANLTIGTLTVSGTNASLFVISSDLASGRTVAPGGSVTATLVFQPPSSGSYTATLNIPNNANTLSTLLLTGSATPTGTTSASVTPSSINFGFTLVGTSKTFFITATNTGTVPITFEQVVVTSAFAFVIETDSLSFRTLQPNAFSQVSLTYSPASGSEVATGDVAVTYDSALSAGNVGHVALFGRGQTPSAVASLSSSTLSFPNTNTGVTSSALVLTVTNTGTANLVCGTAGIGGTNASEFARVSDNVSGATITPGTNRTMGVTFTPAALGARSATLSITDNAIDSPQRVALTGTGTGAAPIATLSPALLAFGSVKMFATSATQTLTITNTGTSNLIIASVALTGLNPGQFAIQTDNATGQTITPGGNRTVVIVFKPKRVGPQSATVSVTDNAGGSPQATPLEGTGSIATVQPLAKTVYAYYYPNYGLSAAEGFGGETYQGWGGTAPAPSGSGVTHTFAPPTSIASDYYPGDYWSGAAGYPPALYSSSDPTVLKAQCIAAINAGVNVLIVSWKPPPDRSDTLIPALLTAAFAATNATGLPLFVSFMIEPYATSNFTDTTDSTVVTGGRAASNVWRAINYINSTYGAHTNFYRTARTGWHYAGRGLGANVFFLNHPEYDYLSGGSPHATIAASGTGWQTTTDDVHNPALVPLGGLILAESSYAPNYVDGHHFDGGFSYLSLPLNQAGLFNESVFQFSRTYELGFPPTAICVPGVAPGYSGWRTQDTLDRRFPRNNGAFYDAQWNQALNGVAFNDIAITTWNDWAHGTQIEPATNQTTGTGI